MSVVKFYPRNAAQNPDNVLEQAVGIYDEVFVIGYNKDGVLEVRSSTNFRVSNILFALESFKFKLLHGGYEVAQSAGDLE